MAEGQQSIRDFVDDPSSVFDDARDYLGQLYGRTRNHLRDIGIEMDWLSQNPLEAGLDADDEIWVYQHVVAFSKGKLASSGSPWGEGRGPLRQGSPSPELQFKTGIYVVGEPTHQLRRRFIDIDNPRLVTLFDTGVYEGYTSGFGFSERDTYKQEEEVSVREVEQKGYGLGVPWWEVEAYDEEGNLTGYADGYFNPFSKEVTETTTTTGEQIPQREVWKIGSRQKHETGDRYQISPPGYTQARERARNAAGKQAYINGFPVGSILQGGRIRLKVEYSNPAYASNYSRKQIIEGSGTPYQALSQGANLYKVREDADGLYFSTTKPEGFSAPDHDEISPEGVGVETTVEQITEIFLDDDEPTQFIVETDTNDPDKMPGTSSGGRLLGLYDPIVVRDIERGTQIV